MEWSLVGEHLIKGRRGFRHLDKKLGRCGSVNLDAQLKGRDCSGKQTGLFAMLFSRIFATSSVLAFASFLLALTTSSNVHALGVGGAETESYIGQPLSVRIPLFNVQSPNSLGVTLDANRADYFDVAQLTAVVDRSNSQLAIRITSNETVNEPYISFKLSLVDGASEFSKDFTVLLNLAPEGTPRAVPVNEARSNQSITAENLARTSGVMGPYEWAERGNIPEKFGAVLDGQSLWRVARRINKAMGVSQSQMMWSLYEANPDAFSGNTIDSLKAGSFLIIPSYEAASRFTEMQAKRKLDQLSGAVTAVETVAEVAESETSTEAEFDLPKEETQSFQMTGLDETPITTGVNDGEEVDGSSQQIISSLADTVNNLSEELVRKDKRIEFLEGQVSELKTFIEDSSDTVGQVSTVNDAAGDTNPAPVISEAEPSSMAPVTEKAARPWWHWVLMGLGALLLLGLIFRSRLAELVRSLNFFGSNDSVAFSPLEESAAAHEPAAPIIAPARPRPEKARPDYSVMTAVDKPDVDEDEVEGISYLELDDDVSFGDEDELELVSVDEIDEDDSNDLTFDERFERLLDDKDYDFARELLDFARYNEINDDRYHCERLRLFKTMKDEDGFYEYYYEIEAKIPDFPTNLQTQISQFVVQLAQQ